MTKTLLTLSNVDCSEIIHHLLNDPAHRGKEAQGYRDVALFLLMLDAGLRVGEAVRLRLDNVTYAADLAKTVHVPSLISKSKQERFVPMTERLTLALNTYRSCSPYCENLQRGCFLFCQRFNGRHLSIRQAQRIIRNASWHAIGRPIHCHALRHTYATRLLRVTNTRNVQILLGHKHLTSTQIYTHPNSEDLKEAVSKLD